MKGSPNFKDYKKDLTGPCVSLKTPFDKMGNLDYEALFLQIERGIESGVSAIVLTYGDSLFSILSEKEIAELTKKCAQIVKNRIMLVAATGIWATGQTREFAALAANAGADMLMVMPPEWEASGTIESLTNHFSKAGEYIPVMVANNFLMRRSPDFSMQLIRKLYDDVPQVVALKDDVTGSLIQQICLHTNKRWALIAGGQKQNHMNMLPFGVDGYFSLMATFNPSVSNIYWNAIRSNNLDTAIEIVRNYDIPLFKYLLSIKGGFDAGIHGMLELAGLGQRYRRAPYHSLDDEQMEDLENFLKSFDYLERKKLDTTKNKELSNKPVR